MRIERGRYWEKRKIRENNIKREGYWEGEILKRKNIKKGRYWEQKYWSLRNGREIKKLRGDNIEKSTN